MPRARCLATAVRAGALALGVCGILGATGCQAPKTPGMSAPELVATAREHGIRLEDPMALSPDMEHDVDVAIDHRGEPRERIRKLIRLLNDRKVGFEHVQGVSLPVARAYREHRGDCMTYAMLFVSLSRYLGIETYFVHASEVLSYYENEDSLFASSHIAVGYGESPGSLVVDFSHEYDDWHLASYRRIDDAAAVALYFNNLAAYDMIEGRTSDAAKIFSFLVEARPNLEEPRNNLIVANLRMKHWNEALEVAAQGMARFPDYKPFYTNAIMAAYDAGNSDLAHRYEARAQEISANDPLYVFARGLQFYREMQYAEAARQFERALASDKDSIVISAWRVRALMLAGQKEEAMSAFARMQKQAPGDRRLRALRDEFQELRGL